MSNTNGKKPEKPEEQQSEEESPVAKSAGSTVARWITFTLALLAAVVTTVINQINISLAAATKPTIAIPWWIWLIVGAFFVLLGAIATLVIRVSYDHHHTKHNKSSVCDESIEKLCSACGNVPEGIQEKFEAVCSECSAMRKKSSEDCQRAIACMSEKITEQEEHLANVNRLVENAKNLERLYATAVSERLRTNKQVVGIESSTKPNSEIFMMTSSFLLERYDVDMRNSIVSNINKNVKYRYIIPIGSENDFKQMVYAIFADKALKPKYKNCMDNDFLTATTLRREYFMLTIGYYDVQGKELSEVVVKLPADTLDEVALEKPLTYLVQKGVANGTRIQKHNSEHKPFLDNLKLLYDNGKKNVKFKDGNEIKYIKSDLTAAFPEGVDISNDGQKALIETD